MIFAAAGSQKFPFDRLFRMLDQLAEENEGQYTIFAQTGCSDYLPKHYSAERFLDKESFDRRIAGCDVLITHGGVATIVEALKHQKPIIVVPRLAKYKEHVDDHQIQIAESFQEQDFVIMYREGDSLSELVRRAQKRSVSRYVSRRETVLAAIRDFLDAEVAAGKK